MTDDDDDRRVPMVIPPIGEGNYEGEFCEWSVRSGDFVKAEESIGLLNTDKVTVELVSPAAGVVVLGEVLPGTLVKVNEVIAYIEPPPPIDAGAVARHLELLALVANHPDDFSARRAYADFLLEGYVLPPWGKHTVECRGEYIDAVLRLAQPGPDDDIHALTKRRKELDSLAYDTARSLITKGWPQEVEDGFVTQLAIDLELFVSHHAELLSRAPLRKLTLTKLALGDIDRLHSIPRLPHVRTLGFSMWKQLVQVASLMRIVVAPAFASVERLELDLKLASWDELRAMIAAMPPTITSFDFSKTFVGDVRATTAEAELRAAVSARIEQ